MPNAGKSTLLSVCSAAKPKVADYPFTTVDPVLGVVEYRRRDFLLVEIPGLIEGAHEGVGLGHEFLRHATRTRLLWHLVDGASDDVMDRRKGRETEAIVGQRHDRRPDCRGNRHRQPQRGHRQGAPVRPVDQ